MFWRRRKLPEDDEPLVPHGLISQAMEDVSTPELPPDMLDSPKDVEQFPAEPVEMRLRVSAPAENRSQETVPLPEQGKISPPLKWPRADEAEIARRAQGIDTAVSFPYRKPIVSAAVPDTDEFEPEPEIADAPKLELVEVSPVTAPVPAVRTRQFKNLLSRIRALRLPSAAPIRARVRSLFSQARTTASSGFHVAAERFQRVRHKSGVSIDAAKLRLVDRSQAALCQSRSGLHDLREKMPDLSGATRAWNRVRSLQITVRIPASNKRVISSVAESAKSSWLQLEQVVRRDTRLWASMAMAALSALLALAFISGIRDYGPNRVEAQPTSPQALPSTTPMKAMQSSSPVPSKPSTDAESIHPKPSPIAKPDATKQSAIASPPVVQKKEAVAVKAQKHRARRNTEEDDYVAKDTYVFYGNSGKPSR